MRRNEMTPAIAREELGPYLDRLKTLDSESKAMVDAFTSFGIPSEDLEPGEVEVSVLIPRSEVDDDLPGLARELRDLNRIFGPFLEIATGSRPDPKIRAIASSDFGVYLDMAPQAAAFIALTVERLVALYKNILDIRIKRQELEDSGVPEEALAGIQAHATNAMEEGIEVEVERLLEQVEDLDGRVNELRTDLRQSLRALARRIDHGFNFDVRAEPEVVEGGEDDPESESAAEAPSADAMAVQRIQSAALGLKFLAPQGKPILELEELPEDSALDDPPSP